MTKHSESRLLPYACEQLFELVLDVERYPEFVPGYLEAWVVERSARHLEVEQEVGMGPATIRFRSRAEVEGQRRIHVHATDGPFRRLELTWVFAADADGCRVEFTVAYRLQGPLAPIVESWLALTAPHLLEVFVRRAATQR